MDLNLFDKLVICAVVSVLFSCGKQTKLANNEVGFSTNLWISDTLGCKGYRSEMLKHPHFFKSLAGKTQQEIELLLGAPDFVCSYPDRVSYSYNFECQTELDDMAHYRYKPRQDCDKNMGLGSFLSIVFNKAGKVSISPLIVNVGG